MHSATVKKQRYLFGLTNNAMSTFKQMYRLDNIFTNLIALALCGLITVLLQVDWLLPHPAGMHHFLIVGLEILAAIQIIKSGKYSLLLPTVCIGIGSIGLILQHFKLAHFPVTVFHLQTFVVIGSIGIGVAILNIR